MTFLQATGTLQALAVSGSQRASALPDVPTTVEAGYPNSEYNFWAGVFLPGKTPPAIKNRLHAEIVKALTSPVLSERLKKLGADPMLISPAEFDALVKSEIEREHAAREGGGHRGELMRAMSDSIAVRSACAGVARGRTIRAHCCKPRRPAMSTVQTPGERSLAPAASLVHALARNWWIPVVRGVIAIVFGVMAFVWPGLTALTLVYIWGAYALVDGVLAIAAAVMGGNPMPRWWLAVVGVAGIVAGLLTFIWPSTTALVLVLFIAAWAIVLGILDIYGAIKLRKEIEGEWFLILNGAAAVLFGVLLFWQPGIGALAVVYIIGAYAIFFGIIYVALGLKLRGHKPA